MYDVLIVDDEPLARQSLQYLIDWEARGFAIRDEAADGREAMELLRANRYSLVLTDIRMPTMSGLELVAELRRHSDVPVVIMTGYDDFEYARQGIKLGIHDYLLKPVDEDELDALLARIAAEIAEKELRCRQRDLGLGSLRDRYWRKRARGRLSEADIAGQAKLLELDPAPAVRGCMIVEPDAPAEGERDWPEREAELKRFAVRNIVDELCEGAAIAFADGEDRFGVALIGEGWTAAGVRAFAERIAASVRTYAKMTVSIGIGGLYDGIGADSAVVADPLSRSFADAETALDGQFLSGAGSILPPADPSRGGVFAGSDGPYREAAEALLEACRSGVEDGAGEALDRLWETFRAAGAPSAVVRAAVLELLVRLHGIVKQEGADAYSLFRHEHGDYERVARARTSDELRAFAAGKCRDVLAALRRVKELQPDTVVGTVKRIVREQYGTNVSLRSVARQVFLHPHYLGKLFKSATGMSFHDYLLHVRMEKAKELLRGSDMKVYEIAKEVGYGELDWFYKRFKAYTGKSASEYRADPR